MRFIERFEGVALIIVTLPLEDKYLVFHVTSFLSMHSTIKQRVAILGLQLKAGLTHEVEYQAPSCQLTHFLERKKYQPGGHFKYQPTSSMNQDHTSLKTLTHN